LFASSGKKWGEKKKARWKQVAKSGYSEGEVFQVRKEVKGGPWEKTGALPRGALDFHRGSLGGMGRGPRGHHKVGPIGGEGKKENGVDGIFVYLLFHTRPRERYKQKGGKILGKTSNYSS